MPRKRKYFVAYVLEAICDMEVEATSKKEACRIAKSEGGDLRDPQITVLDLNIDIEDVITVDKKSVARKD